VHIVCAECQSPKFDPDSCVASVVALWVAFRPPSTKNSNPTRLGGTAARLSARVLGQGSMIGSVSAHRGRPFYGRGR